MGTFIDLTGQKINRWKVIQRAENRGKAVYWQCQCECGTIKDVKGAHLRSGASQSCGCLQKEVAKEFLVQLGKHNINDLSKQKFGYWTVIEDSGERASNGSILWKCKCECGVEKNILGKYLLNDITISCGCKTRKSKGEEKIAKLLEEANIPFQVQKTFDTCRFEDTNALARFDFFVDGKYLIEYDGEQHFYYSDKGWATEEKFKKTIERDKFKTKWCQDNNIPLIRIPYTQYDNLTIKDLIL